MKQFNFAILSAGNIAKKMGKTVSAMTDLFVPYAIASRDARKAKRVAAKYNFINAYDSYEAMLQDPMVDVVYIGTPNALHYDHVKLCLSHNKHVLCEKPFAINETQARELIEMGREKKLFVGEAMWTAFMPYLKALKEMVDNGIIGQVSSFHASFGANIDWINRMTNPELAGGALLDLGVYTIMTMKTLFGMDIASIKSEAVYFDSGVDKKSCTIVRYKDGITATLISDMSALNGNKIIIYGDKGHIEVQDFWCGQMIVVYDNRGNRTEYPYPFKLNGYGYEIERLYECLSSGRLEYEQWGHKDTLDMLHICDLIKEEWNNPREFTL